ncbi:hypothetical protein P175DRAFT_0530351 [Aspergillus ochraceoroseus IBT 24754]|uniref:Uncharacterized protein n=1 Tax=Aspergillus ochraceoroseus IBT 24754 TaxID=1392256 RepID=A0A2T5M3Z4_9EURO|nr:uncharacterized protein P175DRAFT_0530351 [Aspergillus ochraceoroseus IBT 24754]PTU23244.1 hypothetical protein P175DRAFT_0530351 [Aspergillus ochraceoroseus IBT 24754]
MPDFMRLLPRETCAQIIQDVVGGRPERDADYFGSVPAAACLVNRHWNMIFTPLLYSRYEFKGNWKLVKSPWCFLRTLVLRPDLAAYITHLTLTTNGIVDAEYGEDPEQYYEELFKDNHDWYLQAMYQAGFVSTHFPTRALTRAATELLRCELNSNYQKPLTALILAHCPNLKRLRYHACDLDPFLDTILAYATGDPRIQHGHRPFALAFQKLESLYLGSRCQLSSSGRIVPGRSIQIGECRPYQRLPQLKELVLLETKFAENFSSMRHSPNNIQQLTLGFTKHPAQLDLMLSLSPKLTQLSLFLLGKHPREGVSFHRELWGMLDKLKDNLEYLDIYQGKFHYTSDTTDFFPDDDDLSFCPKLPQFKKLRQLNITPLLLNGHRCKHAPGKRLSSHLPPNLESLGLYGQDAAWIAHFLPALDRELEGVAVAGAARSLKSIVVDDERGPNGLGMCLPYFRMRDAAASHAIRFHSFARGVLLYGGADTPFGMSTYSRLPVGAFALDYALCHVWDVIPHGMEVHNFKGRLC